MYERCLNILVILARLAASTLLVPVTLVAGLMTFPTTCQCGADYPHEHPLFGIAGHRHDEQRTTTGGPDTEYIRAGVDGVTVQPATESASPALTATRPSAIRIQPLPHVALSAETILIPDGTISTPDIPPPRA